MLGENGIGASIIDKNIEEMYGIYWDGENLRLIFAISDKATKYIKRELEHSAWPLESLRKVFPQERDNSKNTSIFDFIEPIDSERIANKIKFNFFSSNLSGDFGFGKVFKYLEKDERGFTRFAIELANLGEQQQDYIVAISATLNLLTDLLNDYRWGEELLKIKNSEYQFLTFKNGTNTSRYLGRNGIHGCVSASMKNWLKENYKNIETSKITEAMVSITERPEDTSGFVFSIRKGGFVIDCPGNACGLNPDNWYDLKEENKGFKFSCHNVDGLMQQVYLLIGLASLCDLYRKDCI